MSVSSIVYTMPDDKNPVRGRPESSNAGFGRPESSNAGFGRPDSFMPTHRVFVQKACTSLFLFETPTLT